MNGEPTMPPPPPRTAAPSDWRGPDWREGPRASTRALQAVVLGGAAAGALWGNGVGSAGTALWFVVIAAAVAFAPTRRDPLRFVALGASVVFAGYLALRASPWLIPLNLLAVFGLVAIAAVVPADRRILRRPAYVIARFLGLFRLLAALLYVARPIVGMLERQDQRRLRSVMVGLAIAVPLVAVLGALLAAGDAVFSAAIGRIGVAEGVVTTGVYVACGAVVTTTLMLATSRSWGETPEPVRVLGPVEVSIVAAALALLYAGFAVTQAVATFDGADAVLETAGLTRAEYARAGFFQLLWAAGLTLAALLVLDRLRRREGGTVFAFSAVATSLLTLLVVAVSVSRLLAYVDDFGWTMLRLYTVLFAAWIGVLFAGLALRFTGIAALQRHYPTLVAVTALVWLLGVNVLNPEAFVARENLADPAFADADYVVDLSSDATATILDGLEVFDPVTQAWLVSELCEIDGEPLLGNLGAHRAHDALAGRC
ncbi:MAG: DUF4153 domain-containing protein [Actinomycetota bacterium]